MPDKERYWQHKTGDMYGVILANVVTGPHGHVTTYSKVPMSLRAYPSDAKRIGFQQNRSDDFNIGVWRDGKLVALLWMRKIVDDSPESMEKIVAEIGEAHA